MTISHTARKTIQNLGLLGLLLVAACQTPPEPTLYVTPSPILSGDPIEIDVQNLDPNVPVSLRLDEIRLRLNAPAYYTSSATFEAGPDGRVSTASDAPIDGDYSGVDQAGLFWTRSRPEDQQPDEDADLQPLTLSVDIGNDGSIDFEEIITIVRSFDGIVTEDLGPEFPGAFLARPLTEGPHPVIIVLGGSEGHDTAARDMAPHFASRGYLAIGVPYYSPGWGDPSQQIPGLPSAFAELPVDYLETITEHIKTLDEVDADRIGIWGASKGAEYALLAGALIGDYAAIAAIVPSDVVWEGWGTGEVVSSFSWRGEALPFVPYKGMQEEFQKPVPTLRIPHDAGRAANPDRIDAARIPVETIEAPVLLVGGDEDTVWGSGPMARIVAEQRDAANLETELFVSETAGHNLSRDGYTVSAVGDAQIKGEAYPAMLAFFDRHLKSAP